MRITRKGYRFEVECDSDREALKVFSVLMPLHWDASTTLLDGSLMPGTLRRLDVLASEAQETYPDRTLNPPLR